MKTTNRPVPRERKEIFAAPTTALCEAWNGYDANKHDVLFDAATGIASVYRKRKAANRGITKPITRELNGDFKHYKRPLVVTLLPTGEIRFRLKGCRDAVQVELEKLYTTALQWRAFRIKAEKRNAKAAKRASKRAERRTKVSG